MALTDEHVKKLNRGDLKILEKVHVYMYHSLCLYGKRIVPEIDVVEDVIQEAFIVLWDKREEFTSTHKLKAYLYAIVRNKLLTYLRLKKTVSIESYESYESYEFDQEDESLGLQIIKEETFKLVRDAIANLPERTQMVIKYKLSGHSNSEIAELLDISVNTVKTLQKAGYAKLREKLKDSVYALVLLAGFF